MYSFRGREPPKWGFTSRRRGATSIRKLRNSWHPYPFQPLHADDFASVRWQKSDLRACFCDTRGGWFGHAGNSFDVNEFGVLRRDPGSILGCGLASNAPTTRINAALLLTRFQTNCWTPQPCPLPERPFVGRDHNLVTPIATLPKLRTRCRRTKLT